VALQDLPLPENHAELIYEGADMSRLQSFLAIRLLFDRHRPSREMQLAVLNLVALHAPPENRCFSTLHEFEHFLGAGESTSTAHGYCGVFKHLFLPDQHVCPTDQTPRYGGVNGDVEQNFFLTFSIETELRTRFRDAAFLDAIRYPLTRQRPAQGVITDTLDTPSYPADPVLGQLHALGSTDGLRVFKSARSDVWLFMMVLLELPPSVRYKQENMLLVGAWFGGKKPDFTIFFKALAAELNPWQEPRQLPTAEGPLNVSLKLLTITADNAAKEAMLCYSHCGWCEQEPEMMENAAGRNTVPTFPLQDDVSPARTRQSFIDDAMVALERQGVLADEADEADDNAENDAGSDAGSDVGSNAGEELGDDERDEDEGLADDEGDQDEDAVDGSHGITGPTPLLLFNDLDLIVPQEYQHGGCLRPVPKLMQLWFGKGHAGKAYSIRPQLEVFDRMIADARPPAFITRPPRSWGSHGKFWKAVEYRALLLYYGPIVLRHLLPHAHYNHFLLLSDAFALLLRRSVSADDRLRAHQMLVHFLRRFPLIYGQRYMSRTIHHLLHFVGSVERWGPLWATSTFPFSSPSTATFGS